MLIEALAAGVVGVALLWLVLQPLLLPRLAPEEPADLPDPEETPRGQALLALHEIDFDRATGKLSDADYHELHARYSAAAVALLDSAPAAPAPYDPVEALIASHAAAASPGARHCRRHGSGPAADALFCPACGAGLLDANECCAGCGTRVPMDAAFCPGCGRRVENRE